MNDREHQDKRRRTTSMTALPENVVSRARYARYCIELIDVLTRRQDLHGREDLVSVAASLRLLVPPGTTLFTAGDLLHLVETFGVAVRVAGFRYNALIPTAAEVRNDGPSYPTTRRSGPPTPALRGGSQEDANRQELVSSAIDISRFAGLLSVLLAKQCWCSEGSEQAAIQRAAADVIAATRVAVALADPAPGSVYAVWQEEHRMRLQAILDDVERSRAAHAPQDDVN